MLKKYFTGGIQKDNEHVVLLIDEVDHLAMTRQSQLYNIFDWARTKDARLSVVCIANTMDLQERLHARVVSRLGPDRLVFHPYSFEALRDIVTARVSATGAGSDAGDAVVFQPEAADLCARKISHMSGDARRALALARQAVGLTEQAVLADGTSDAGLVITRAHMAAALEVMFAHQASLFGDLSLQERLFILSLWREASIRAKGESQGGRNYSNRGPRRRRQPAIPTAQEVPLASVWDQHTIFARMLLCTKPSLHDATMLAKRLSASGLVTVSDATCVTVRLRITDVELALAGDEDLAPVLLENQNT